MIYLPKRATAIVAVLVLSAAPVQAADLAPLTSFGGGDGWRAQEEVLVGDAAGTETGGIYNYLGVTNLERGLAYNPTTGNLILVSRNAPGNGVGALRILNGTTGVDIGGLDEGPAETSIITGGSIFTRDMIAAADDGAIYLANLTVGGTANYKIYRWANEAASPTVAYDGVPLTGARIGDSFDAIGSGADTRLTAGYHHTPAVAGNNSFALFDTADGLSFTSTNVSIGTTPPNAGDFRLGITFQDQDTVIGRQSSSPANPNARIVDVTGSTGTLAANFVTEGNNLVPMDFAVVDGTPLLALVGTAGDDSRLYVYDLSPGFDQVNPNPNIAASVDLPFNNPNGNNTGQVKFGAITGNTAIIYAMSTNNGIQAFTLTLDPAGQDGDHNEDGVVDAADYVAWRKNPADFGGDPAGYDTWLANFGEPGAGSGGGIGFGTGAVPEPSGLWLVFIGVATAVNTVRRRG